MNFGKETLADGDISKLVIRQSEQSPIEWEKGMNAVFHYTVHAYVPSSILHVHHDSHESCCSKKNKIQNLLAMIDKSQDDTFNEEEHDASPPVRHFIADSRQHDPNQPFELRIGYSFSVKAMEICVKSMKVGEKSRFLCQNDYATGYAQLELALRKEKQNKINKEKGLAMISDHICSGHANPEFMESLSFLQKIDGYPLEYEIELIKVQKKGEYLPDPWEMTVSDRYNEAVKLKESANASYKRENYKLALEAYSRSLIMVESLVNSSQVSDMKRELKLDKYQEERQQWLKTQDKNNAISSEDHFISQSGNDKLKGLPLTIMELETLEVTLRLNYSACQLKLGGFNQVITQCSEILNRQPSNLKALYRRGEAYLRIGRDLDLAIKDCETFRSILTKLDPDHEKPEWIDWQRMDRNIQEKQMVHKEKEKELYSGIFKS